MVTAYPVSGKTKSYEICRAFTDGCGGRTVTDGEWRGGPAVFWGVNESNFSLWQKAKFLGDYYYGDNSYFDAHRQQYFRFTKNALQHSGTGKTDGERFAATGIEIAPWRERGGHIVVCQQSNAFMQMLADYHGNWILDTVARIHELTKRSIQLRFWAPDKKKLGATLDIDLVDAHALVTWSSTAAVTALLSGVPIVAIGPSAMQVMSGTLEEIEHLPKSNERLLWAGVLADNEWTPDELRSGLAWEKLNA